MTLTGPQTKQIQDALLVAFGKEELTRMVQFQFGVTLSQIADGKNDSEIVFHLIQWADRENRVLDLIDGALAARPGNEQLQDLQSDALSWHLKPPEEGKPPYQGLQYFGVNDAGRFFGREKLTARLVGYLRDHRFLAVIGASGSGKSSVVRAGVVPALKQGDPLGDGTQPSKGSADWLVHIITPTVHPLKALSASLTADSESVTAQATLIEDMQKHAISLDLFISRVLAALPAEHLLLVVDQFEELFTLCKDGDERRHFVDNLMAAAQPDGETTVIITLRADFYHRCAGYDELRQALANGQTYSEGDSWVKAMTVDELRAAIEKPAALGGWDFEPGLVDVLLGEVSDEPGGLPLLSHALLETWNNRRGRIMTFAGYYAAGGVKGAIATRADTEFTNLSPEEQTVARNIFVRLTELGEGSEDTRRRVARADLLGIGKDTETVANVLATLGYARLITVDENEVEVAHEALIREWPTLRSWLEENREGLRIHLRLTEAAKEWHQSGREPGDLYRGTRLSQTAEWAETNGETLNDLERDFLDASRMRVEAEEREREATRQRELQAAQDLAAAEEERAKEAEARLAAEAESLQAAQDAQFAEEEARQQAEARLAAEEQLRQQAEALQQAETERAEDAEDSAHRLRRRAWYLGAALLAALLAIGGTLYFGLESQSNAVEAQQNAELATERLSQFGQTVGGLGAERLLEIVQDLEASGDIPGAMAVVRTAVEQNSDLADQLPMTDSNQAKYRFVPAGEFTMGSDASDDLVFDRERPQHSAKLDAYWIMQTEVTNEQYGRCVQAGVCPEPTNDEWHNPAYAQRPVTHVSWDDANAYAIWVGGRLPTEAEWEMACRSTDGRLYPWGNEAPNEALLNYSFNIGSTTDVGSYPAGANGLYDMAGNVWEWTSSLYGDYPYDVADGREDAALEGRRVVRGGAFRNSPGYVRCAYRDVDDRDSRYNLVGFRCVAPGF